MGHSGGLKSLNTEEVAFSEPWVLYPPTPADGGGARQRTLLHPAACIGSEPLEVHLPSESTASGSGQEEKARVLEEDVRKHGFWKRIFIAVRKQRFSSERAAPRTNFWSLFVWN